MKTVIAAGAALGLAVFLSGCATVSKAQCEAGQWEVMGINTALAGKGPDRFYKIQEDCGRHGIAADEILFVKGWEGGRRTYCSPQTGFRDGQRGSRPGFGCPEDLADDYRDAYGLGTRIRRVEEPLRSAERSLEWRESRIDQYNDELDRLDCSQGSEDERLFCRAKRDRLREDLKTARFGLDSLRYDIREKRRVYEATLADTMRAVERRFPGETSRPSP
ncbi:DUF2799 domain-containing protein [Stappia sp.]|uniref:DUF2799 domain-containing protein n=1 Tax=Stappia sp. TaxID=1870903 RepID=UPI0032D920A1